VSQERFVSFLHLEHKMFALQTGTPPMTGTIAEWGFTTAAEGGFKLETVESNVPLVDAMEKMEAQDLFGMGVVDHSGVLIGVLTAMDLKEHIDKFTAKLLETPVGEYIKVDGSGHQTATCQLSDPFLDVFQTMAELHCQMLHIVDEGGRPTGVIRLQDAIQAAIEAHCETPPEMMQSWEQADRETQRQARHLCSISLLDDSGVLNEGHMQSLWCYLPSRLRHRNWRLLYSTAVHGCSLDSFYRHQAITDEPVITVLKEVGNGRIFGTFNTEAWKLNDRPYGKVPVAVPVAAAAPTPQ